VKLVGSIGLPMPKPPDVTESKTFDPTDSLYKTQPQPKPPEPPKPEVKIPEFKKEKPPKQIAHPSKTFDNPTPVPDNAVAQHGGKMDLPTGTSNVAGAAAPGVTVQGQGGGDFASRYGWYIDAVRRKISANWQQATIDPAVRAARVAHCTMTFYDRSRRYGEKYQRRANQRQLLDGHFRPARPAQRLADAGATVRLSGFSGECDFRFRSVNDTMNDEQ